MINNNGIIFITLSPSYKDKALRPWLSNCTGCVPYTASAFLVYLTLSYRHLNSLTPGTFTPTPQNKFIHGPYLAFFTIYNCLSFESLNLNISLSENHFLSALCVSFQTQHFTSLMFLIPGGLYFTQTIGCFLDSLLSSPSSPTMSLLTFTPILCCPFVALALPEPDSGLLRTHCPMWWPVTMVTLQMFKYYTAQIIEPFHYHRKLYRTATL